jgi:hypothetical protein
MLSARTGWALGNFKCKERGTNVDRVWYPDEPGSTTGMLYLQQLLEADYAYGPDRVWLALKREEQPAARGGQGKGSGSGQGGGRRGGMRGGLAG